MVYIDPPSADLGIRMLIAILLAVAIIAVIASV